MKTTCNKCAAKFEIDGGSLQTVRIEDLDIQFFLCPSCGWEYVVFALNDEMKKLVDARAAFQTRIRAARLAGYREKTLRRLITEQLKIEKEEKALWLELKSRAEQLLKEVAGK